MLLLSGGRGGQDCFTAVHTHRGMTMYDYDWAKHHEPLYRAFDIDVETDLLPVLREFPNW